LSHVVACARESWRRATGVADPGLRRDDAGRHRIAWGTWQTASGKAALRAHLMLCVMAGATGLQTGQVIQGNLQDAGVERNLVRVRAVWLAGRNCWLV
jgi:hypothetical protein